MDKFIEFIQNNGASLNDINPGSKEYALSPNDALYAIDILYVQDIPVLGGDILSKRNETLNYVHNLWGNEYISLSWSSERALKTTNSSYLNQCREVAIEKIHNALDIAREINKPVYIVLVPKQMKNEKSNYNDNLL